MVVLWRDLNRLLVLRGLVLPSLSDFGLFVSMSQFVKLYGRLLGLNSRCLSVVLGLLSTCYYSRIFYWFNYFSVVGYNYNVRAMRGRAIVSFYVGLVYRIIIKVPSNVRLFVGKRRLFIVSSDLVLLKVIGMFIRNLRNLLPYVSRGIIYKNEGAKFKAIKKK